MSEPLALARELDELRAAARAGPRAWEARCAALGLEAEPLSPAALERALTRLTARRARRPLSAIFANAARTTARPDATPAGIETLRCRRCGAAREGEAVSSCQYCGASLFEQEPSPWTK